MLLVVVVVVVVAVVAVFFLRSAQSFQSLNHVFGKKRITSITITI